MITALQLSKPRDVVYAGDGALAIPVRADFKRGPRGDKEYSEAERAWKTAWDEYQRTYDVKLLERWTKPGRKLTIFVIGSLTPQQERYIENHRGAGDQMFETLAFGVRDIVNLSVVDEHGKAVEFEWKPEQTPIGPRLPDQVLAIFCDDLLRVAIWAEVKRASKLSQEAAKSDPA